MIQDILRKYREADPLNDGHLLNVTPLGVRVLVLAILALLQVELTDLDALQIELVLPGQALVLGGHLPLFDHIV